MDIRPKEAEKIGNSGGELLRGRITVAIAVQRSYNGPSHPLLLPTYCYEAYTPILSAPFGSRDDAPFLAFDRQGR